MPAGTPLATRTLINRAFNEPFSDPGFEKAFLNTGDVPGPNTIAEFEAYVVQQKTRWVGTANRLGLKLTSD